MNSRAQKESNAKHNVLSVRNLQIDFRINERNIRTVRNLSFNVMQGKTLAIVGESGSGKSVTSLALMRLVEREGGCIKTGEMWLRLKSGELVDLVQLPESRLQQIRGLDIAMIFQEPMTSLNPSLSVGYQISEVFRLHRGMSRKAAWAEALRMLEKVRIPNAANIINHYPHTMSGGMRQRVMIAIALACHPTLLIADEPTTALDVTIQAQILSLIRELQSEIAMGVIFITHDMGVVAEMADDVLVVYQGNRVEAAPVKAVFFRPKSDYTRALLAVVPHLGSMNGTDLPTPFPESREIDKAHSHPVSPIVQDTVKTGSLPILQVKNLVVRYGLRSGVLKRVTQEIHAVEEVSFDLYPGETLSLVGESGSGKSTIARALLQLVKSQSGKILLDGKAIHNLHGPNLQHIRRDIQYIFQDPYASLDPRHTIGFSIIEPLIVHKIMPKDQAFKYALNLLQKVGLSPEMASRFPHEFSGGQRQRICIARALTLKPKIIIADEIISALDVTVQANIINLLMKLQRESGLAYLFISHDMATVERISHRVAVLYKGRIIEIGNRRQIFESPQHPYTRGLMAAVPVANPNIKKVFTVPKINTPPSIYPVGVNPKLPDLIDIGESHFVALHDTL